MAYIRDGLDAHVRDHINKQVQSSFSLANPLFYFLGLSKPEEASKLGRPKTSLIFGGAKMGEAKKREVLGSMNHQIRFVKAEPNDGAAVTYGGATPTAAANAEDNFGTAEFRWTHIMEPIKLSKHALEMARGEDAVNSIVDDSMGPVWERFVKRINQGFWTGTRNATQQNDRVWGDFLGLQHTLTAGNVYGRVDRAVETALNPNVINAATDLTTTVADLTIIRKVNNGFTKAGGGTFTPLALRSGGGRGATCWITTSNLWQELANQADGRFQIHTQGIPGKALGGFKAPIIAFDDSYVTYDPYCPAGEMYGLNLDFWSVEVQKGHNFAWLGFTDKSKTEQGGEYIEWGNFSFQGRPICHAPWTQVRVTGLTA
jgi:hypothetical protein